MNKKNEKTTGYAESDAAQANRTPRPILVAGIGRRIAAAAGELKTRVFAANAAGVSTDSLQRYIREENMPAFDVAAGLCMAAGVRMEWLATGEGPMRVSEQPSQVASQPVSREALTMAFQLAEEALEGKSLPPEKRAELVSLIYEGLLEGLPEAQILRFARIARL